MDNPIQTGSVGFQECCERVKTCLDIRWKGMDDLAKMNMLEREKAAILGSEEEMRFYKQEINEILSQQQLRGVIPPFWYRSLTDGVFAELYGLAGLAPWVYDETEEYKRSSSAKLIGDRLYCLIDGKSVLQPQRIPSERRQQLRRALLMGNPRQRMEQGFHELYLSNGIRATIYAGERTKPNQDIMVFRKYLLRDLSFENLAELGTIPEEGCWLFKAMVAVGFNVLFAGTVRSGKTTFLQTWQRYEEPDKEGLAISTDPETPWDRIMPDAPVMQLVADGEDLETLTKSLLRGDNDYVILEEMRDAQSFRLALEISGIGAGRCKATVHSGDIPNLPYKIAAKIKSRYGGDEQSLILQVFSAFHYIFEFCQQENNRAVKKLKSISELCYDIETDRVSLHLICVYDERSRTWKWNNHIGAEKEKLLALWPKEAEIMRKELRALSDKYPMTGKKVIYPRYYHPSMKEREDANG